MADNGYNLRDNLLPNDGSNTPRTFCDGNVENNYWVDGIVDLQRGMRGICSLDNMTEDDVVYILRQVPQARKDLPLVTTNPHLLRLLDQTSLNKTAFPFDAVQHSQVTSGVKK